MAKNITIHLDDHPGALAEMGEALGKSVVNIDGICGVSCEGVGVLHILVEDAAAALTANLDLVIGVDDLEKAQSAL
jgi:hypothetical protein